MEWNITDDRPIWIQLSEQLTAQIASGMYQPGQRLPSVREFAADAGVNPNTMQRALSDLESKGLIITNRTAGRSVTMDMETIKQLKNDRAMDKVRQFLAQMKELGYTREEIGAVLTQALKEEV